MAVEATEKLTKRERIALKAVQYGADVYDYGIATTLRAMDRAKRGLVTIVRAMHAPKNGAARQPYFGAIATAKGTAALDAASRSGPPATPSKEKSA